MLLVQQPQHTPLSPSLLSSMKLNNHHRRIPSAPAAVVQVQPTKIPGLLSLSKPISQHQRNQHPNQPNQRHATPRQPKSRQNAPPATQTATSTPDNKRGRNSPPKDKAARNRSKSRMGHAGRTRQPSPPPIYLPEQAPVSTTSSAIPRSVTPQPADEVATPRPPPATLPKAATPHANGKAAKRRCRASIPFPPSASAPVVKQSDDSGEKAAVKAKPVTIPTSTAKASVAHSLRGQQRQSSPSDIPLSRSDPTLTHFLRLQQIPPFKKAVDVNRTGNIFPVCDDTDGTDAGFDSDRPGTPTPASSRKTVKTWQQQQHFSLIDSDTDDIDFLDKSNGPHTAPARARRLFQSEASSPSPAPRHGHGSRPRHHQRAPSVPADSLFGAGPYANLSFESDSALESGLSSSVGANANLRRPRLQSSRATSSPNGKGLVGNVSGSPFAYASSTFQNSPSPEQLPPPTFSIETLRRKAMQLDD